MASREHKIVRRAEALAELSRLSGLIAERYDLQVMDAQISNRDAELAEIQRLENVNGLLGQLLQVQAVKADESETTERPATKRAVKHGAGK